MNIIKPELTLVVDAGNYLGESPVWSPEDQSLYWINCENTAEVHRWNSRTGKHNKWPVPERIGGLSLKDGGGLLIVLANGIYDMELPSGSLRQRVASPMQDAKLHESITDRDGRLWVGAYDHRIGGGTEFIGGGTLFRLENDKLIPMVNGIQCSNALAISPDGTRLYHSDSTTGIVKAWSLARATGDLSGEEVFAQVPANEGYFDGATVDSQGGFWVALVFGGKLRRYNPDKSLDLEVTLPFSNPSKVAFGGPDLDTLFITTTQMSMGSPLLGENMHGGIYAFRPGVKGVLEVPVRI